MGEIVYGTCVGTWEKFHRWVEPRLQGRSIITASNQTSLSVAYNRILQAYADGYDPSDIDMVVLIHDDLELIDPDTEEKLRATFDAHPDAGIVGVCGGGPSMSWWGHNPIGHQRTDSMDIVFDGPMEGRVHMVEGSFLAIRQEAIFGDLRFDDQYKFLGYDDVCLHAIQDQWEVWVADIDTHHHSTVGFKSPQIEQMWRESEKIFIEKWGGLCATSPDIVEF